MFERFTKDARETVTGAQSAARELGASSIGSEHLLHVIVRAGGPVADAMVDAGLDPGALRRSLAGAADPLDADALASIGIDLSAVRERADEVFGPGALDRTSAGSPRRGHLPFTKDAKKVLEIALREAIALKDREIRTDHMVLAMVRIKDSAAHRLLVESGADPAAVRAQVLARRPEAA